MTTSNLQQLTESFLIRLARLENPNGYDYIFTWNTKIQKYVSKRVLPSPTNENRRVFDTFQEMHQFYTWCISKGFIVREPLDISVD